MKIFKRVMLGLAATFAGIGLICFIAAFFMGLTFDGFMDMVYNNKFSYASMGGELTFLDPDGFLGGEDTQVIEKDYENLEIDYNKGELEIYYGDVRDIQVYSKDVRNMRTMGDDDTVYIQGGLEVDIEDGFEPKLTIILPYDMKFEHVTLKIGASHAKIDGLQADEVEIEIGAGQADITNMNVGALDIEVGAGETNITNLTVGDLKVEVGVGEANVELCGAESYYNYKIECGIREVIVGNNSYGGMGTNQNIKNPGANFNVDIECGIGQVNVQFTETAADME